VSEAVSAELRDFLRRLPKAELHIHIEGSLEPEMLFALARKHGKPLRFDSVEALRRAYDFENLQSFLDLYYDGASVLRDAEDFYDLALAYLRRAHADGVVHAEIFFDPQTHTARGVPFAAVMEGLERAIGEARRSLGMSALLLMCFLRDRSEGDAMRTLEEALPYGERITGVGLDSAELGHPPSKFARVFEHARRAGLRAVAHAGEEGPPRYIHEALDVLRAERIDHGVRCEADEGLVRRLAQERIPLTVCPSSNVRLKVFARMEDHNLKRLLERGLCVTVNSDDPAYFGGYVLSNYLNAAQALDLSRAQLAELARNSITASFLGETEKRGWLQRIEAAAAKAA
jgi:adenosine deaminase